MTRQEHGRGEPTIEVLDPGISATIQDLGRFGYASYGVGTSGAADQASFRLANRLIGNDESDGAIEAVMGGLHLRAREPMLVAVTGAASPITVDGIAQSHNSPLWLPRRAELRLGWARRGAYTYVAVRGGIAVEPVLGSRSRDSLAGLGPPQLAAGTVLPVGAGPRGRPTLDHSPGNEVGADEVVLRALLGPRDDWFERNSVDALYTSPFRVTGASDRVGARLEGVALRRCRFDEFVTEGTVAGSIQVSPDGQPTIFQRDHPVTGGYPVIAVVLSADLDLAAQVRPGTVVRFARPRA